MTVQTISDRVRQPGQGFILGFPTSNLSVNGETIPTYRAYFFQVTQVQDYYYEYTQLGAITNGNPLDYNYLGDTGHGTGDDIFRMNSEDFQVTHFGYSPESPDLRVYEKVDPSNANTALDRSGSSDNPDPTAGDDHGFITRKQIANKYDPPVTTERVAFRNDKAGQFLQWGFYAESDVADGESDLYLTGASYTLAPVTDRARQDRMLRTIRGAEQNPDVPTIFTRVGGLESYTLGTNEPDNWQANHSRDLTYGLDDATV